MQWGTLRFSLCLLTEEFDGFEFIRAVERSNRSDATRRYKISKYINLRNKVNN